MQTPFPLSPPRLRGRQIVVLGAVLIGLVIPMLLTTWHTYSLQERAREQAFSIKMDQITGTLASGLSGPVWNLSPASGRALVESVVRDPDVVSLVVQSLAQGDFLAAGEAPDGPAPRLHSRRADILFDGEKIGAVTVLFNRHENHGTIDNLWT